MVCLTTTLGCHKESLFPDTSSFDLLKMDEILQNIHPTVAADYLELRMSLGEYPVGTESFSVQDSVGMKCMNDSVCLKNLFKLPVQKLGCLPGGCFYYLVSTSGPEVEVWNSVERLKQLFGEIDTSDEAALMVFANGYWFNSTDHVSSGTRKTSNDSFQVV